MPLRQAPRAQSRGRKLEDYGDMAQAGRSWASLLAEQSVAEVRAASPPMEHRAVSLPAATGSRRRSVVKTRPTSYLGMPDLPSPTIENPWVSTFTLGTVYDRGEATSATGTFESLGSTSRLVKPSPPRYREVVTPPRQRTPEPPRYRAVLTPPRQTTPDPPRYWERSDPCRPIQPSPLRYRDPVSPESPCFREPLLVPRQINPEPSRRRDRSSPPRIRSDPAQSRDRLLAPHQLLRQKSYPASLTSMPRSESPKLLQDLGRDYSRYPVSESDLSLDERKASSIDGRSFRSWGSPPHYSLEMHRKLDEYGYPDDSINSSSPFLGGEKGFILYTHEIEDDDAFHAPHPNDSKHHRPTCKECCTASSIGSLLGTLFIIAGLLALFIAVPILTFTTNFLAPLEDIGNPPGSGPGWYTYNDTNTSYIDYGPAWAHVNDNTYNLLSNMRRGLIDPDTPRSEMKRKSAFDDSSLNLVFSDEFNRGGRTFYPGEDPYWTAQDLWYGATMDYEWYDPDAVTTGNGTLQIKMADFVNHGVEFRSGMLNSWNKTCFKGGVLEVSVSLAGPAGVPGLWPGGNVIIFKYTRASANSIKVWTIGNLARPGYAATTEGVWPYSYNSCDIGITPNQSDPDGLSWLPGQKLTSCSCSSSDHPTPGVGRGAPEIDVLEASVDPRNLLGTASQSYQIAPFDMLLSPNYEFMAIPNYETTSITSYVGGPYQQAISSTTVLDNDWYDGKAYQKYAFEYIPGTSTGKIAWFVGEEQSWLLDGRAIGKNGNVDQRVISEEPMAMVLNMGLASSWAAQGIAGLKFPTTMHIDYVRIYQKEGQESLTCDPEGWETTKYIVEHETAYRNYNLTTWEKAGYDWPKNNLTGC